MGLFPRSLTQRLSHADEPQKGRNSCPWLPLPVPLPSATARFFKGGRVETKKKKKKKNLTVGDIEG